MNGDQLVNRVVTQPTTVDIADLEYWAVQKVFPRGVMQGVEIAKIANWAKIVPLFTQGKDPDGRDVSRQGTLPYEVQYAAGAEATSFADGPSDHATDDHRAAGTRAARRPALRARRGWGITSLAQLQSLLQSLGVNIGDVDLQSLLDSLGINLTDGLSVPELQQVLEGLGLGDAPAGA